MAEKKINHKMVLIGDTTVGKSSCAVRFSKDEFYDCQQPTIGAAFLTQDVPLDGYTIKFEIWDTAGQERYRSLAPMNYRGAAAALVIYDITLEESFNGAKKWISELQQYRNDDIVIAIAGNKLDLEDEREVPKEEAKQFADENGYIFYETSAKTGENVNNVFVEIAKKLPKDVDPSDTARLSRTSSDGNVNENKKCCK